MASEVRCLSGAVERQSVVGPRNLTSNGLGSIFGLDVVSLHQFPMLAFPNIALLWLPFPISLAFAIAGVIGVKLGVRRKVRHGPNRIDDFAAPARPAFLSLLFLHSLLLQKSVNGNTDQS
jgi:hypothetical protein